MYVDGLLACFDTCIGRIQNLNCGTVNIHKVIKLKIRCTENLVQLSSLKDLCYDLS